MPLRPPGSRTRRSGVGAVELMRRLRSHLARLHRSHRLYQALASFLLGAPLPLLRPESPRRRAIRDEPIAFAFEDRAELVMHRSSPWLVRDESATDSSRCPTKAALTSRPPVHHPSIARRRPRRSHRPERRRSGLEAVDAHPGLPLRLLQVESAYRETETRVFVQGAKPPLTVCTEQHRHDCSLVLYARSMYVCILRCAS